MPELWRQFSAAADQATGIAGLQPAVDTTGYSQSSELMASSEWSLYLVRCADGSLYTGISTDVERRLREHSTGVRGAKFLRGRGPLTLAFECRIGDRSLASRIEHRVKRLPAAEKREPAELIRRVEELLAELTNRVPSVDQMAAAER